MLIDFIKMQALGNDFVLIDAIKSNITIRTKDIIKICDRKFGIGSDQVLIIEKNYTNDANFNYRIFNNDGKEVEHCGNGARCVISYLFEYGYSNSSEIILLKTRNRIISGAKHCTGILINMGQPLFTPESLPFLHESNKNHQYKFNLGQNEIITFGIVSVGNPHIIIELPNIELLNNDEDLTKIATTIQKNSLFPESVNVNFYIKEDQNNIILKTYERGAGFTLSCGTGAVATVCYGILKNFLSESVTVENKGGTLFITWDKNNDAILVGPATFVFKGNICL